jgi:hypothetical protein
MKPLCSFANPPLPKTARVPLSGGVCFTARIFILSLPIDFAPMSDLMDHNDLFVVKNLVNDAVIANAEFVQSRKVAFIRLWSNVVQICGEPIDTLSDSTGNRFIQSLQFAGSGLKDTEAIHGNYSNPSRRITSSNGSPRSPVATAFF